MKFSYNTAQAGSCPQETRLTPGRWGTPTPGRWSTPTPGRWSTLGSTPGRWSTLLRVDGVLVHHVAQVALARGQQVVGARHEPGVLAPDM